jgi:hypothetical protein
MAVGRLDTSDDLLGGWEANDFQTFVTMNAGSRSDLGRI